MEGHDGIYEVRLNGRIVHSNRRACGAMVSSERILQELQKYRPVRPGVKIREILPLFPGDCKEEES